MAGVGWWRLLGRIRAPCPTLCRAQPARTGCSSKHGRASSIMAKGSGLDGAQGVSFGLVRYSGGVVPLFAVIGASLCTAKVPIGVRRSKEEPWSRGVVVPRGTRPPTGALPFCSTWNSFRGAALSACSLPTDAALSVRHSVSSESHFPRVLALSICAMWIVPRGTLVARIWHPCSFGERKSLSFTSRSAPYIRGYVKAQMFHVEHSPSPSSCSTWNIVVCGAFSQKRKGCPRRSWGIFSVVKSSESWYH